MTYLDVVLVPGERWTHTPPATHDVAWAYVYEGDALVNGEPAGRDLLLLGASPGGLAIEAGDGARTRVLVGTAEKHPHRLVLGQSSIHTNEASLGKGMRRIREIGAELRRDRRI
jgi:redox-sensitive bicupin YhaK (pirin superfamily)